MDFSVVIPARGRTDLLRTLLENLNTAKSANDGDVEILILDDSDEPHSTSIKAMSTEFGASYIRAEMTVGAKRNLGARMSNHDIVVFLDSDVRVSEDFFRGYEKVFTAEDINMAIGLLEFYGEECWYWKVVKSTPFVKCFDMPRYMDMLPWGCSCNMAVRRDFFLELSGFSDEFREPAGEDVDLGLRVSERHIPIVPAKESVAFHSNTTWSKRRDMIRRACMYGRGDAILVERHPDSTVRSGFRRWIFFLAITIICCLSAIVSENVWMLLMIPALLAAEVFAVSTRISIKSEDASLCQALASQELVLRNELSYILACVSRGHPGNVFRQIVTVEGQAYGILEFMRFVYLLDLGLLMLLFIFSGLVITYA